jgi:putative transposase
MPYGLKRFQKAETLHFITFSCFHRLPFLEAPATKDTFEFVLEQTRSRHRARVYAYVLMPEHIHLLINEPPLILVAQFLKALKQITSRNCGALAGSSGRTVILTRTSMAKQPGPK